jgi:tetratricopeptide (TPR) repeat protein
MEAGLLQKALDKNNIDSLLQDSHVDTAGWMIALHGSIPGRNIKVIVYEEDTERAFEVVKALFGDDEEELDSTENQEFPSESNEVDFYLARGTTYIGKGDYDRAIADYNQAIRLDPNYVGAYVNRSWYYIQKGEYDKALADCNQALRLNPNNREAYYVRGLAYKAKGNQAQADRDFVEAKRLGYTPWYTP